MIGRVRSRGGVDANDVFHENLTAASITSSMVGIILCVEDEMGCGDAQIVFG